MTKKNWLKRMLIYLPILIVATGLLLLISPTISVALSQTEDGYFYQARSIETDDLGISSPTGLGFSAANNALLVLDESSEGAKV
ncbi:MAG: hypothetical protein KAS38_01860, partial [Anaerolineales bacterium]|nr:hypothetical protein [Anaerolineales bacterium]